LGSPETIEAVQRRGGVRQAVRPCPGAAVYPRVAGPGTGPGRVVYGAWGPCVP